MTKAVFLDRDDTICKDVPYCSEPHDLLLIEGAGEALFRLKKEGFLLLLVTNQSGISRGYFTHEVLFKIHDKMQNDLLKFGVLLDDIFYCPCHPSEGCEDRKPEIGMFLQASKKYNIDKEQSYMVGDKEIDIRAGKKFGISTILVTNKDERGNEDYFASDISEAVNWIIDNGR